MKSMTFLTGGKETKNSLNEGGFSLIEVLIAITVFSVFISAYVVSQGQNLNDSIRMSEELLLKKLTEKVLNEQLLNPPELTRAQSLQPVTKRFEQAEYEGFEYTIEFQKVELPDLSQLGLAEDQEDGNSDQNANQALQKRIYQQFTDNIERIVWQIRVTVKNTNTEYTYVLSTFLKNRKAEIKITL